MPCSSGSSSCSRCLELGSTCGWCQSSLSCIEGGRSGPAEPSSCDTWAWYYTYCAGDPADKCPPLSTCSQCLTSGRADPFVDPTSCGWCTDASNRQRCASGQIGGPAIGARCRAGGWLFSQFDTPALCPALPASPSRTSSPTPTLGGSPSPTPTLGSSPSPTPTLGGPTPTSGGSGGGGSPGPGSGGAAAADLTQSLVVALALSLTLGLLLACACGVAVGWVLRARFHGALRGEGKPRPGSVAFGDYRGSENALAPPSMVVTQFNPVGMTAALRGSEG